MIEIRNWVLAAWTALWLGMLSGAMAPALAQQIGQPAANAAAEVVPNNTTGILIAAGGHSVTSIQAGSISATPAFIKVYDTATAPTCGSGTPVARFIIPGASASTIGAFASYNMVAGFRVFNGLGYCVTTGIADSDTTAPAANNFIVNIDWN